MHYTLRKTEPTNENISQFADTQNVIRNKFEKACMNRHVREQDVHQAMKPLASICQSTPDIQQQNSAAAAQNNSNQANKTGLDGTNEPNELCDKLKQLISSMVVGDVNHAQEINAIIMKLREQEILL